MIADLIQTGETVVENSFKCLHCGYEYKMVEDLKKDVRERLCPKCKSNSVRKLPQKTE